MLLGNIIGKSGTNEFYFLVKGNAKKFMYVKALHKEGYNVLAQIVEVEKEKEETKAKCNVLGYRDETSVLRNLRTPLEPGLEIFYAEDEFVKKILDLELNNKGAYIGVLEDRENIKVYLDLNKLITKHVSIIAKSGSGKSFCSSVLLEEILEKKIPIVVIDPHGEYSSLKYPTDKKDQLKKFGIESKGYYKQIQEYSPDVEKNPESKPLKLNAKGLTGNELMHLLPAKLSGSQIGLLYGAMSDATRIADFDQVMLSLQAEENNAKWALINVIDYLKKLNIFADIGTNLNELVNVGKCSIINLRGVPQEIQEIVVYKLLNDLFNTRKQGIIPPFFLVIEESHTYCPERSFGEAKSSGIIRQILAEGRKFGLGVALITQRPARIEKSALSQCTTQIILKITNPNDLRAISSSVEGITSETETEILNLHIGKAMIIGVADMPLFVEVRARRTRHGGESIDVVGTFADAKIEENSIIPTNLTEPKKWIGTKEVISMIRPKIMKNDIRLLVDKEIKILKSIMIPCYMVNCIKDHFEFNILINLNNGNIVTDIERGVGKSFILNLDKLSEKENKILNLCLVLSKEFNAAEIFSKSGLMFSEVYDIINNLVKKNLLIKNNDKYLLGESLNSLINLKDFACYEKNEFISFEFDDKLEIKYKINEIIELLKRFTEIKNFKECNLVKYDIEYF